MHCGAPPESSIGSRLVSAPGNGQLSEFDALTSVRTREPLPQEVRKRQQTVSIRTSLPSQALVKRA